MLSQIIEGWKNNLFPKEELKEIISISKKYRLSICNTCLKHSKFHSTPLRPDEHCTECGCTLSAKTACLSCECPLKKWEAVISQQQEQEINGSKI